MTATTSTIRILGVDPGTRILGYGLVDATVPRAGPSQITYVECGVVKVSAAAPMPQRLASLAGDLAEVIAELRPDVVALEQAFTGRNAASALKLGLCRGAVMLLASQHELGLFEYAPAKIKRVVVGHGRATKQDVQRRVRLLCRLRREPSADAADALAIALCHAHLGLAVPAVLAPARRRRAAR